MLQVIRIAAELQKIKTTEEMRKTIPTHHLTLKKSISHFAANIKTDKAPNKTDKSVAMQIFLLHFFIHANKRKQQLLLNIFHHHFMHFHHPNDP